jgi:adenosylcobalamin-dependent ribonucleoside-triphosphate reductase
LKNRNLYPSGVDNGLSVKYHSTYHKLFVGTWGARLAAFWGDLGKMTIDISVPAGLSEPKWGALGEDVFRRTYSRKKADGSQESWAETCRRVVVGNCSFVDKRFVERGEPERLFDLLYNFKLLPGGRHLWATGVKGAAHVANCWATGWTDDFAEHFEFAFARLMEGGGVGSNYSDPFLRRYEAIPNKIELHIVCDPGHADYPKLKNMISHKYSPEWGGAYQIGDSREGWVAALGLLLRSFYKFPKDFEFPEGDLVFDVSHVRPAGSPLKRFGGTASGPTPLTEMLLHVCLLMNVHHEKKPDSFLALDIDHEIAQCVVAGNVRRSARMSMKHWKDTEIERFIRMKEDGESHSTTNISVVLDRHFWTSLRRKDPHARKILRMIAEGCLLNGEPGIFNITKANEGEPNKIVTTNPCGEVPLPEWGACNLGSVNLRNFAHDRTGAFEAFRLVTRFLLRATFADYLDPKARGIIERDRRIGVGFTGFADWLALEGRKFSAFSTSEKHKDFLRQARKIVRNEAREYAFQLRIPEPVKVTTCAPTGSTSKLCGVSEGMQPVLFRHFKRRVSYSTRDPEHKKLIEKAVKDGLEVEDYIYTPETKVVSYPCRARILDDPNIDGDVVEEAADISLEEYLDTQKSVQDTFVDNSISFTLNIDPEQVSVEDLEKALASFGPHLKGTTVMPFVSNRPQMPYESMTREEYEKSENKFSSAGEWECKNDSCRLVVKTEEDSSVLV